MKINDIILLKRDLDSVKIGQLSNENLRKYLKLSVELNKYNTEFENKRTTLIDEAVAAKGFDINTITAEQDQEIGDIVVPILNEYLSTEVEINTKILSWNDLFDNILNLPENISLSTEVKSRLAELLCTENL